TCGIEECCRSACAVSVASVTCTTSQGGHDACGCSDLANRVVDGIGNIQVSSSLHGYPSGSVEMRAWAVIAAGYTSSACECGDRRHARRDSDHANGVVIGICHVDVSQGVYRHASGAIEVCVWAVIAAGHAGGAGKG